MSYSHLAASFIGMVIFIVISKILTAWSTRRKRNKERAEKDFKYEIMDNVRKEHVTYWQYNELCVRVANLEKKIHG